MSIAAAQAKTVSVRTIHSTSRPQRPNGGLFLAVAEEDSGSVQTESVDSARRITGSAELLSVSDLNVTCRLLVCLIWLMILNNTCDNQPPPSSFVYHWDRVLPV